MHSFSFLTLTVLIIGARSQDLSTIIHVTAIEGEDVELKFPYPCGSTTVTVQHRNKRPMYNSEFPDSLTLQPDQLGRLTVSNVTENGNCSICINIVPVKLSDEGPYILFAYNADHTTRIMLVVDFPTDKLYCRRNGWFSNLEGKVVRLLCTAPAVHGPNVSRHIQCFQGGMRMVPLNELTQTDTMIEQTIMVLHNEHLVFCCSSPLLVAQCECNDLKFIWDPVHDRESTRVKEDPCPDPGNVITPLVQDSRSTVTQSNQNVAATIPPGMSNKKYRYTHWSAAYGHTGRAAVIVASVTIGVTLAAVVRACIFCLRAYRPTKQARCNLKSYHVEYLV